MDSAEVKRYAKACGADLVGIGSMDRYEGTPKQFDLRYIMPEAKSIIVLGFRIFRGLLRGIEEGTLFQHYSALGYTAINKVQQPMMLWQFCRMFEDEGYEALPMSNMAVWAGVSPNTGKLNENWSRPVSPEKPAPDVLLHMRLAAYIAGLGEIGYSKVFLTPEFGPRVRFAAVLTEAELEPDPVMEPGTLCDRCMACVRECSGQAISATKTVKVTVAGKNLEWGELDTFRCSNAYIGTVPKEGGVGYCKDGERSELNPFDGVPTALEGYGRAIEGAAGCIRACMIHLEAQGKMKNVFREKFRRRKPWKIDRSGEAAPSGSKEQVGSD